VPSTIPAAAAAVLTFGDAPALIENGRAWSFKDLYRDARGAASALRVAPRPGGECGRTHAWSRLNMANYKVPREIEFRAELPKNAAGKVLRTELRRLDVGTSPR